MKISKCKQLIHFKDENLDSLKNKENISIYFDLQFDEKSKCFI